MNRAVKQKLIYKLVDSISVISGNAQIAALIDHPKWSVGYIRAIIDEIDNTLALLQQVAELCDIESRAANVNPEQTKQLYH